MSALDHSNAFNSLPHNPPRDVHRVLAHFELSSEQQVI